MYNMRSANLNAPFLQLLHILKSDSFWNILEIPVGLMSAAQNTPSVVIWRIMSTPASVPKILSFSLHEHTHLYFFPIIPSAHQKTAKQSPACWWRSLWWTARWWCWRCCVHPEAAPSRLAPSGALLRRWDRPISEAHRGLPPCGKPGNADCWEQKQNVKNDTHKRVIKNYLLKSSIEKWVWCFQTPESSKEFY